MTWESFVDSVSQDQTALKVLSDFDSTVPDSEIFLSYFVG